MDRYEVADTILFHRKKSGLSQQQLATLAGVGKTVVFDIEKGKQTIKLDTLLKILAVLNINIRFESPVMKDFKGESKRAMNEKG